MILRRRTPDGWEVPMSSVVPKFSRTRGEVRWTGPELGADDDALPDERDA
jgi:succinyl-CoA---D-citramalate CoA-transferase